jgi:hypothetical protein
MQIDEDEKISECGNYRYYVNTKGAAYIQCKMTNETIDKIWR